MELRLESDLLADFYVAEHLADGDSLNSVFSNVVPSSFGFLTWADTDAHGTEMDDGYPLTKAPEDSVDRFMDVELNDKGRAKINAWISKNTPKMKAELQAGLSDLLRQLKEQS